MIRNLSTHCLTRIDIGPIAAVIRTRRAAASRSALGAEGARDQLDEPWAVDELDRVFGGELLGRERERARRDEEALVAVGVMDRAQKFLEDRRADDRLPVILALNDGKEPIIAAKPKVGPFVAGAADLLDLVSPASRRARRRTPRTTRA